MDTRRSRRELFRLGAKAKAKEKPPDLHLLRVGRPAMGTRFEILFSSEFRASIESAHRALDEIRRLESLLTIFSEESQICEVNREASDHPVAVAPEVYELLERSRRLSEQTEGAFDVTAGALWRCWGFHRKEGVVPDPDSLREVMSRVGWQALVLEPGNRVRLERIGLELNLGSIGKGFALDRASGILQNSGLGRVLLHAGHSSFLGVGEPFEGAGGWRVSIRNPVRGEPDLLVVQLKNRGMATSGVTEQYFEKEGRTYGHIVDPRTGWPASRHLSATAVAATAAEADALSTAFFVMETAEVEDYCQRHPDTGAILVPAAEKSDEVPLMLFGCAEECIREQGSGGSFE